MKIFVGLGNPGDNYKNTRHNAGFLWIDSFYDSIRRLNKFNVGIWQSKDKFEADICEVRKVSLSENENSGLCLTLVKPQTFMNRSGIAIKELLKIYKIDLTEDLYIVHDDLDIELGKYKFSFATGPKEHKGIISINSLIGVDYNRIRLGVDNRLIQDRDHINPSDYVLAKMTKEEREILDSSIYESIKVLMSRISF